MKEHAITEKRPKERRRVPHGRGPRLRTRRALDRPGGSAPGWSSGDDKRDRRRPKRAGI